MASGSLTLDVDGSEIVFTMKTCNYQQIPSLRFCGPDVPWAMDCFPSRSMKTFTPEFFPRHRGPDEPEHGAGDDRPDAGRFTCRLSRFCCSRIAARERPSIVNAIAFALFIISLLVTVVIEVPIVEKIVTWTVSTIPNNWEQLRDRWIRFHGDRVIAGLASLAFLVIGAIY